MSLISRADGRQQQKVAAVLCNALMDPPRKSGQHQGKRGAVLFISFHCPATRRGDDDVGRPPLSSALSIFDCCRAQLKGRRREGAQRPPYSVPRIYISHLLVPFPPLLPRELTKDIYQPPTTKEKKNSSCLPTNYLVYSVSAPIKFKSGYAKKKIEKKNLKFI